MSNSQEIPNPDPLGAPSDELDPAGVEAAAREIYGLRFYDAAAPHVRETWLKNARAAITAYLQAAPPMSDSRISTDACPECGWLPQRQHAVSCQATPPREDGHDEMILVPRGWLTQINADLFGLIEMVDARATTIQDSLVVTMTDNAATVVASNDYQPRCPKCGTAMQIVIDMGRVEAGVGGPRPTYACPDCAPDQPLQATQDSRDAGN